MPEWLIERGIGETRAALIDDGEILEAQIELDGTTPAGSVVAARLTSVGTNGRNAIAVDDRGTEYLLPRGAPGLTEGARLAIEITRERIPAAETWKRPLARMTDKTPGLAPLLAERMQGRSLPFPGAADTLGEAGWNELIEDARTGVVRFTGGELRISPTPAMTLIDVDGYLPPEELSVRGAAEAARAIRRLDIGGSIGIDLPTTRSKAARQQAAAAVDQFLPQPFERTAVNGFGFIQLVRPRLRPSLIELAQDRAWFEARTLLRRVALEGAGSRRIVANPAVARAFEARPEWIAELGRQVGGAVELRRDATIGLSAGYAENAGSR